VGAEEDRQRSEQAARDLRDWAKRERAAGDEAKARRLEAKADSIHRLYGTGQRNPVEYDDARGTAPPSGGTPGCLLVCMLVVLAMAPAVAWPVWELLA
jgi:hypothetical protein